jgi:hypothetical protein
MKLTNPKEQARTLIAIAADTIENGVRNVAIIDYYLKHVTDTSQLCLLDRWLAEQILSLIFRGRSYTARDSSFTGKPRVHFSSGNKRKRFEHSEGRLPVQSPLHAEIGLLSVPRSSS